MAVGMKIKPPVVFATHVDSDHILGFTLKVLEGLPPDGIHPPSVSTQLSVIAWNQYESATMTELLKDIVEGPFEPGYDIHMKTAMASAEYQKVLLQRGTLRSEFLFGPGGVTVMLVDPNYSPEESDVE